MSNEPDGFWDTRIEPDDYPVLVHNCRMRLDEAGKTYLYHLCLPISQLLSTLFNLYFLTPISSLSSQDYYMNVYHILL